jgi:hypothetical protein
MGNSGSTISDLFYLDNPKRRRRAEELKGDIYVLQAEFSGLKAHKSVTCSYLYGYFNRLSD